MRAEIERTRQLCGDRRLYRDATLTLTGFVCFAVCFEIFDELIEILICRVFGFVADVCNQLQVGIVDAEFRQEACH